MLLEDLFPDVRIEIPEAPEMFIQRTLLRAAREFCMNSRYVREDVAIPLVDDTPDYLVTPTAGTEVLEVVSVLDQDGEPLTPKTPIQLDKLDPLWRTANGPPKFYINGTQGEIIITPRPLLAAGDLTVTVATQPTLIATDIDDRLGTKYGEALVFGALGRLFLMPRQKWTSKASAKDYLGLFMAKYAEAECKAVDNHTTGIARKVKYGGY